MAIWRYLQAHPDPPEAPLKPFRQLAMVMEFKQHQLRRLMTATLAALHDAGFQLLLLKGAAVTAHGLGEFLDRPMADLDILLPERDARCAWEIAQRHGWVWDEAEFPLRLYRDLHHLPPLIDKSGSGQRLEIHHDLFARGHPFAFGADTLWTNATVAPRGADAVPVPSLEDVLLHVCLHFSWSHAMQSKVWRTLHDVYAITASGQVEWPAFITRAAGTKAATGAYWTLRLATSLTAAPIPRDVLHELRPPRSEKLMRLLERHYIQNMFIATQRCPSLRIRQRCWELGMCPTQSGHGSARPWNVSITLPATAREREDTPSLPHRAKLQRLWRTARYLMTFSNSAR